MDSGRRPGAISVGLVHRILTEQENTRALARSRHCSTETIRRRCRLACEHLVQTTILPTLPPAWDQPLAIIVDGLQCRFDNEPWVFYNMAVKPAGISIGFFLEPVLIPGREEYRHWCQALATIPDWIRERVRALVSDGLPGFKRIAATNGWVLQRCHRHLDVFLWGCSSPYRKHRLSGGKLREVIIKAVREIRTTPDRRRVDELREVLLDCSRQPELAVRVRGIVRRLLHDLVLFRTYLDYPELTLPTTTNAVESRNSLLRNILRCVNNPSAALLRVRAYTRQHPTITCNGHENPQHF